MASNRQGRTHALNQQGAPPLTVAERITRLRQILVSRRTSPLLDFSEDISQSCVAADFTLLQRISYGGLSASSVGAV